MQISVSLLPALTSPSPPEQTTAVVIDVLRATTVMAVACQAGVKQIITFADLDAAHAYAERNREDGQERCLLGGERLCAKPAGFDFGNSPAEYTAKTVAGRRLVMTTTNGTRALVAALPFAHIGTAAFVNLEATLRFLKSHPFVQLICAGTEGAITLEDTWLAGALVAACQERYNASLANDEAELVGSAWRQLFASPDAIDGARLAEQLGRSQGGRNLIARGHADDLARCAAVNSVEAVPQLIHRQPITLASD